MIPRSISDTAVSLARLTEMGHLEPSLSPLRRLDLSGWSAFPNDNDGNSFMTIRNLGAVALALILAFAPFYASAQQGESGDDPLVATVNGKKIYRSEVLETARSLPPQYQQQQQLDQVFPALVDRLVDFRLLAVAAAGLAEDEEVLSRLAELQQNVMREV